MQYTSRFTNSAGGVKELYYSNGGMMDMDKQTVTPTGGLTAKYAVEMEMKANLLPSSSLVEKAETVEHERQHARRSADGGTYSELDGVRALTQDTECPDRGGL